MKTQFKSLKTQILFTNLILSIVPIILLGSLSYFVIKEYKQKIIQNQYTGAEFKSAAIEQWFAERSRNVEDLAKAASRLKLDPVETQNLVEGLKQNCGEMCESVTIFGPDGVSFADFNKQTVGQLNLKDSDWFQSSMNGNVYFSEISPSPVTGMPIAYFSAPVKSDDGKIIAVAMIPVQTAYIAQVLQGSTNGQTGDSYLVNQNNFLVTQPRFWDSFAQANSIQKEYTTFQIDTITTQKPDSSGAVIAEYLNYEQKPVLGVYIPLNQKGWGLILEYQTAEIYQLVTLITYIFIGIFCLVLAVVIWLSLRMSITLVNPIQLLSFVIKRLAMGDVNLEGVDLNSLKRIHKRKDELGEIGTAVQSIVNYNLSSVEIAGNIAEGNLNVNAKPRDVADQLGHAQSIMINNLRELVGKVAEIAGSLRFASDQLANAAKESDQATFQISTTIQQVATGITQQTESISKTASSAEQMGQTIEGVAKGAQKQSNAVSKASSITNQISTAIQQVAVNAQTSAKEAAQAAETARNGANTVHETITGMQTIKSKVGLSAEKVQEMGKRSDQIGVIVETIDDIASQTNLLALNAAIEAARAGEYGKGFAVVADEVRKLAERSSFATKEIGSLIKAIQQTVAEAVSAMDEGAKEVENGVVRASQSEQALASILKTAETVNRQVGEIAQAAQHISASSNELVASMDSVSAAVEENTASTEKMTISSSEVTRAVEAIASVSEQNSAAVEEVSASTEEMSAQVEEVNASAQSLAEMANSLQKLVGQFKI